MKKKNGKKGTTFRKRARSKLSGGTPSKSVKKKSQSVLSRWLRRWTSSRRRVPAVDAVVGDDFNPIHVNKKTVEIFYNSFDEFAKLDFLDLIFDHGRLHKKKNAQDVHNIVRCLDNSRQIEFEISFLYDQEGFDDGKDRYHCEIKGEGEKGDEFNGKYRKKFRNGDEYEGYAYDNWMTEDEVTEELRDFVKDVKKEFPPKTKTPPKKYTQKR